MSFIALILDTVGQGIEYAVDTEVTPAVPFLEQSAVVERQWRKAAAVVGTPVVPAENAGLARELAHGIQFHTTEELEVGTAVRFAGREYSILNMQAAPEYLDALVWRYQARVQVKGISNAV